jgi:protein phosphatase
LKKKTTFLELDGSFVVIGDLHGHFLDLDRIFRTFRYPKDFKYLFLGDLVDREDFSLETMVLISL